MTTTSAAEKLAGHSAGDKKGEKVEKRRALGRGLASLLPGPRVVSAAPPQELKPESSLATSGTAEAVPFPTSAPGGRGDGVGIPRFARNDITLEARNDTDALDDKSGRE